MQTTIQRTRQEPADTNRPRLSALRWVFGVYFVAVGIMHFVVPPGLPVPMAWMYDLSTELHYVAGTAEVLGGLGLILPRLTGVMPSLTYLAAVGLAAVMIGAMIWHLRRGEVTQVAANALVAAVMGYVAFSAQRATRPAD